MCDNSTKLISELAMMLLQEDAETDLNSQPLSWMQLLKPFPPRFKLQYMLINTHPHVSLKNPLPSLVINCPKFILKFGLFLFSCKCNLLLMVLLEYNCQYLHFLPRVLLVLLGPSLGGTQPVEKLHDHDL